jgi:Glutathione S-transferase, N-terminal domain
VIAKVNNLDLEYVETQTGAAAPADYLKYNGLGKIPTFVGADGYVLSEVSAIVIYRKFFTLPFQFKHHDETHYSVIPVRSHNIVENIHTLSYLFKPDLLVTVAEQC